MFCISRFYTCYLSDAGFVSKRIRLLLKACPASGNHDQRLPRADTCFFNVELPSYSSTEVARRQLSIVINVDWGLDGDDVLL